MKQWQYALRLLGLLSVIVAYAWLNSVFTTKLVTAALEAREQDIDAARQQRALAETVSFIEQHMPKSRSFGDRFELLRFALEQVEPGLRDALYCEFGVFEGESINFIADLTPDKKIHGFDSFEGLPEDWRGGFRKGAFAIPRLPKVRKNVVLYKGWFNESLPQFRRDTAEPLAFAHLDADLYSSTRTVLEELSEKVVAGTVLVFDEFFNYPGWQEGEQRAWQEFVDKNEVQFTYLGYCRRGQQLAVKVQAIRQPAGGG
jgi:hypothetical protein